MTEKMLTGMKSIKANKTTTCEASNCSNGSSKLLLYDNETGGKIPLGLQGRSQDFLIGGSKLQRGFDLHPG